jgi:hypothetical protein
VNVPKEKLEAMGWQNPPAQGSWEGTDATEGQADGDDDKASR